MWLRRVYLGCEATSLQHNAPGLLTGLISRTCLSLLGRMIDLFEEIVIKVRGDEVNRHGHDDHGDSVDSVYGCISNRKTP